MRMPNLTPAALKTPGFGFMARMIRDHVYEFDGRGFMFTSAWVNTRDTRRHAATVLLSASGDPFVLECEGQRLVTNAALIPPLAKRTLHAFDVGLISINLTPNHWSYSTLKQLSGPLPLALEGSHFQQYSHNLMRAYRGEMQRMEAEHLADQVVGATIEQLPGNLAASRRTGEQIVNLLNSQPEWTLPDFAAKLHLSYDRASHVVAETVGLSLKSYQYWRKMFQVWDSLNSSCSLTEAAQRGGFSDSAHLARTWKQKLGTSPSYIRDEELVSVMR